MKPHLVAYYHDLEKKLHVSAVLDRFLFDGSEEYGGTIVFASALGPHSAVRGLLAAIATGREIRVDRYRRARFHGREGSRILSAGLADGVIHGCYVGPQLLASEGDFAMIGDDPERILDRLNQSMALPVLPAWAGWLCEALKSKELLRPLSGVGVSGSSISAREEEIDELVSQGVRTGALRF